MTTEMEYIKTDARVSHEQFTEDELKFIRDNWRSMTVNDIADALGRTFSSVYSKGIGMGLGNIKMHIERADIVAAYKEHKTCKQLAEELGVGIYRVRNAEKAYGIKLKNSCKKTHRTQ